MTQSRRSAVVSEAEQKQCSIGQSVVIGSAAGAAEVFVDHPLWTIKTRLQRGEPLSFNPRVLYRGILPNAASMIPITALQVGVNRGYQKLFFKGKEKLTPAQRIGAAFVAGLSSSLVSCPTEMVMTYQGQIASNFFQAGRVVVAEGGVAALYRGFLATALREGKFTGFFLGVRPELKEQMEAKGVNKQVAAVASGVTAGVAATAVSQAVDTVKTVQQSAPLKEPIGFLKACENIYAKAGAQGFFKGVVPRGTRVTSAVTLMGGVADFLQGEFERHNAEKMAGPKR